MTPHCDNAILRENKAFEEQREAMLKGHRGEYVLMKGGAPVEFFTRHDDAFRTAVAKFGLDGGFLISRVERPEVRSVSLAWDAGVMFGK